jgi:hypothetical protein
LLLHPVPLRGQQQQAVTLPPVRQQQQPTSDEIGKRLTPVSTDTVKMIRDLCLAVMPEQFEELDNWNDQTRIQSGLHVRMDGLNIRTHRQWKNVNHGQWRKAVVRLVDPQTTFQISVFDMPTGPNEPAKRLITAAARLRVVVSIQQWNYGVRVLSISADAIADVSFRTEYVLDHSIVATDDGLRLKLSPTVSGSKVQLDGFSLRRVGQLKGPAAREYGELFEPLLRRRLHGENETLDRTINEQLEKETEKLQVPLDFFADLFGDTTE